MALKKKKGQTGIGITKLFQESSYQAPAGTRRIATLDIMPDPDQPRRLLPPALYEDLFSGRKEPAQVLAEWLEAGRKPKANPALRQTIADLEQLATTIAWRDLISPITLRPLETDDFPRHVRFLIRTGERRWWAHVWLMLNEQTIGAEEESPQTIRALIEEGDANIRADQWIENQARTDFSVVENALGLEAVRAEMSRGKPKLVPWREVEARLGVSNNYRLRIINVLRLNDEVVGLISQYGLTERSVRPLVDKLAKHPEYQLPALMKLLEWRTNGEDSSNRRLSDYIDSLLTRQEAKPKPTAVASRSQTAWVATFGKTVNKALNSLSKVDDETWPEIGVILANDSSSLQAITDLRDRLDALIEQTRLDE
jgi:ParB/RepB/Spo0J family partition protein